MIRTLWRHLIVNGNGSFLLYLMVFVYISLKIFIEMSEGFATGNMELRLFLN